MEEGVARMLYNEDQVESAQDLCEKLLCIERKRKHFGNQQKLFEFQKTLFDIARNLNSVSSPAEDESKDVKNPTKFKTRKFTKSLVVVEDSPHQCPHCDTTFVNFKSLQRHARKKHPEETKISSQMYQKRNIIICLLGKRNHPNIRCNKQIEKNRICRHLRDSHGTERPAKKEFRGFLTDDNGDTYLACFTGMKENDPPEEELIEEDEEDVSDDENVEEPAAKKNQEDEEEERKGAEHVSDVDDVQEPFAAAEEVLNDKDGKEPVTEQDEEEERQGAENVSDVDDIEEPVAEDDDEERQGAENVSDAEKPDAKQVLNEEEHFEEESPTESDSETKNVDDEILIETKMTIDVEGDGSFNIVSEKEILFDPSQAYESPASQDVDSQESVFISGAVTKTEFSDRPNSPNTEYYLDSQGPHSCHNTGFQQLPDLPGDNQVVAVKVFNKNVPKIKASPKIVEKKPTGKSTVKKVSAQKRRKTTEQKQNFSKRKKSAAVCDEKMKIEEEPLDGNDEDSDSDSIGNTNMAEVADTGEGEDKDEVDSDDGYSDTEDNQEFSKERWEKRNLLKPTKELHTVSENQIFINNFSKWWQESGASFVTTNKDTSTLRNTANMLFYNPDCFLNYITSENKSFNLSRLVMFTSNNFLSVPSPVSWVTKVGGKSGKDQPSRRKTMLKAHQNLRCYINHCLNGHNFVGQEIQQKEAVSGHLKALDDLIKGKKLFGQLETLYSQQNKKKAKMEGIIKPFEKEDLHNCVSTWFKSKESDQLETEALEIYKKAMASQYIGNSDFDRFVKIVFFELILFDKSRVGVLQNLTNEDYALKKETWLPPEMNELEFNKLPKDWRLYKPPQPGVPPSSYEIDIIGDTEGIKNQEEQTVCLSQRVYELVEKMRDLKQLLFPEVKLEDFLFVRHNGDKIPKFQNYPGKGSLLYQFGCVSGLDNFCFKMLRKGVEGVIQSSDTLSKSTKQINSHSQAVAQKVYDQMRGSRRNVFLTNLNKKEGFNTLRNDEEIESSEIEKRKDRDTQDKEDLLQKARSFLADLKRQEPWDERPTAINDDDVRLLRTIFTKEMLGNVI